MQIESIYTVNVSNMLGNPEYIGMLNDIARFTIIQIAIQAMLVLTDPRRFSMFSADFIVLVLFVIIGVLFYWLVFKKIISFV
jgi:hypothetical protein